MTAEFFAQSSEAANVDLWPVRSSSSALPGGARGAFTMVLSVLSVRAERRRMIEASSWSCGGVELCGTQTARLCAAAALLYTVEVF